MEPNEVDELCVLRNELIALRERVQYLERLLLNCSEPSAVNADFNGNISDSSEGKRCAFCQDCTHSIHSCEYFRYLQVGDRWNVAKKLKLCFRCLNDKHFGKDCPRTRVCGINRCRLSHDRLLHDEKRRQNMRNSRADHNSKPSGGGGQNVLSSNLENDNNSLRLSSNFGESSTPPDRVHEIESETMDENLENLEYFSDIKNPTEFAKSLVVYETDDSQVDTYSYSDESDMESSCDPPADVQKETAGYSIVEKGNPELGYENIHCAANSSVNKIDISLWLQPLSEPESESCEPLRVVTYHGDNTIKYENIDSLSDALNDLEVTQIEPLACSMRQLKASEFTENGFAMNYAKNIALPALNGPPTLKELECCLPIGAAGIETENVFFGFEKEQVEKLNDELIETPGAKDKLDAEKQGSMGFDGLMSKIKTVLNQDLCYRYEENADLNSLDIGAKQVNINKTDKTEIDLSMWLMPVPDPGGL